MPYNPYKSLIATLKHKCSPCRAERTRFPRWVSVLLYGSGLPGVELYRLVHFYLHNGSVSDF